MESAGWPAHGVVMPCVRSVKETVGSWGGGGETERERLRLRETDRQTDRDRDRETETERDYLYSSYSYLIFTSRHAHMITEDGRKRGKILRYNLFCTTCHSSLRRELCIVYSFVEETLGPFKAIDIFLNKQI